MLKHLNKTNEVIHITTRVTGPILLPNTPDCDYPNGEELLSPEKIEYLKESFKQYGIIDYQHQFTKKDKPYFMTNVGEPVRLFMCNSAVKFEDVTGEIITVPENTLWLTTDVNNEQVEKEVNDLELVAYSVSISEKDDADYTMSIYEKLSTKNANKEEIDFTRLDRINENLTQKRTLIRDIEDPVMLTTSLVKFPCVNKAKFCKASIHNTETAETSNMVNKMTDKETNANQTFIDSIQNAVNKYRHNNKEEKDGEGEKMDKEEVSTMINEEISSMKADVEKQLAETQDNILSAIKNIIPTESNKEEEKDEEKADDEEITDEEEEIEEIIEEEAEEEEEEEKEEGAQKTGIKAGRGGKAHKHEAPLKTAEPSAQKSRQDARINGDKQKMAIKRNEADVIYDAVKNNIACKGITEIDYTGTGLETEFKNKTYLDLLNNQYATEVYKASFSEENTNKAILSTNVFSTFVTKLIQDEPIFLDAQYQTGYHGKGYIYRLDNGSYDTEDGHTPENFYFDADPNDDEFELDTQEIQCYTQRRKVTISDRQRLANVYGDDLVNKVLEISRKKLFRGVYGARVWSDTSLAGSVDKQYKRQDGLLKQAGLQLTSNDVDIDTATGIFKGMFYSLPEEAQNPFDYCFYVPINVYLSYYNYIEGGKNETKYEWVSQQQTLYWNNIPVKVSPALNRADLKTLTYNGDSAILLTQPQNTNLIVGREAGIEPKRNADTSSDTFYETIDTAVAYGQPDYASVLKLTNDEYMGLVNGAEDDSP